MCQTGKKLHHCPRGTSVSRRNGDKIKALHLIPLNTTVLWRFWGFQGALNWMPMMPRVARVSDSYKSDRCCFLSLATTNWITCLVKSLLDTFENIMNQMMDFCAVKCLNYVKITFEVLYMFFLWWSTFLNGSWWTVKYEKFLRLLSKFSVYSLAIKEKSTSK